MEIPNKVIIVTGASSGVGLVAARLLYRKGAKLALVGQNKAKLLELADELKGSIAISADLRQEQEGRDMVQTVARELGRVDVLINNAGKGYQANVEAMDTKELREIYDLNVFTPLVLMQEVIPMMRESQRGAIINISSGTVFMTTPGISGYSSSKRALTGLSLAASEELMKDNIKVTTIYPYITDTNFFKNVVGTTNGQAPSRPGMPPADSPEFIAELIAGAIESGEVEIVAHDWMKERKPA
jgi:short-subunit dehydrogenase